MRVDFSTPYIPRTFLAADKGGAAGGGRSEEVKRHRAKLLKKFLDLPLYHRKN